MKVIKIPLSSHAQSAIAPHHPHAQLSLRAVTALEIVSVMLTVLITAWAIVPLRPGNHVLEALPGLLALLLMLNSHRLRGETPRELGFTLKHFGRAIRLLILPMVIGAAIVVTIGYFVGSLHFTSHFWASFGGRSVWGLAQQYILQAFIYRRVRFILLPDQSSESGGRTWLAISIAAVLFALVHAANWPLMLLTFVSALLWTWVYDRAPNLFALGLSHGLLSAITAAALPDAWIKGMLVGIRHLVYQSF